MHLLVFFILIFYADVPETETQWQLIQAEAKVAAAKIREEQLGLWEADVATASTSRVNSDMLREQQLATAVGDPHSMVCPYCRRAFGTLSRLGRHVLTHTGERPFKCNRCPSDFNRKEALTMHLRTHTGERPYPCPVCPRRFIRRCKLTNHCRLHHPGVGWNG